MTSGSRGRLVLFGFDPVDRVFWQASSIRGIVNDPATTNRASHTECVDRCSAIALEAMVHTFGAMVHTSSRRLV